MSTAGSEKVLISGAAGRLESLWLPAGDHVVDRAVVLCHPHPLYGGTMETKLIAHAARRLSKDGWQTLRFNFRGVGQSDGVWDDGRGERDDVVSAIDYVRERLPEARVGLFGFSFGAALALDVGSSDPRVYALVAAAPPPRLLPSDWSGPEGKPTLILAAGQDAVVDLASLEEWALQFSDPVEFQKMPSADHFFTRQIDTVTEAAVRFLNEHF